MSREVDLTLHYVSVVAHRIESLRKQVNLLSHNDFPSKSPVVLAEIINRILIRLFRELLQVARKEEDLDDSLRKIQTINYATISIGRYVEAIKAAQLSSPVFSIVEAYENIGERINYGTQTIVHPQWIYNASYSDVIPQLKEWAQYISPRVDPSIFQAMPAHLIVITFPAIEENNILRHAVLAHEMGHFVDSVRELSNFILNSQIYDPEIMNRILLLRKASPSSPLLRIALSIVESWIREIIADLIGVCILGPAYIFSFDDIARMPHSPRAQSILTSHPPYELRIMFMIDLVKRLHLDQLKPGDTKKKPLSKEEENTFNLIYKWLEKMPEISVGRIIAPPQGISEEENDLLYSLGERALYRAAEMINKKIDSLALEGWFCTNQDILDALKLHNLLYHGYPPSEIPIESSGISKRYPSFPAIMNSGWFFLLKTEEYYSYLEHPDLNEREPGEIFKRHNNLQNLISKAIENYLFRTEYYRRRGLH